MADAIIAWATVTIAGATIVIAWFTYVSSRILKWEKEKDRRNRQPVLVLIDEINGDCRNLNAENIGYGPALNIVRTILRAGKLTSHIGTNEPLPLQPLGQGKRTYALCATLLPHSSVPMIDDPDFHVRIEYDDIFGNHYETCYKNREHSVDQIAERKTPSALAGKI